MFLTTYHIQGSSISTIIELWYCTTTPELRMWYAQRNLFFKYSTICTDKKKKQKELMIRDHMQYKIHINYLSSL